MLDLSTNRRDPKCQSSRFRKRFNSISLSVRILFHWSCWTARGIDTSVCDEDASKDGVWKLNCWLCERRQQDDSLSEGHEVTAYTVHAFVSSTWIDLQNERAPVERVFQKLRETKSVAMECFGSRNESTHKASLEEVDRSDV